MFRTTLVLMLMVGLAGCGGVTKDNMYDTFPVSGKLTLRGSAVAGASVTFSPTAAGKPASMGVTDAQGMYRLSTYSTGDGAPAGDYTVMVYKDDPSARGGSGGGAPAHDPTGAAGRSAPPAHNSKKAPSGESSGMLPAKYSSNDSPIKKTVTESGEQVIDIDLQ